MSEEIPKFDVFHFSQPSEEHSFSERNARLLSLLPALNDALDHVFSHTVTGNRQGLTIFMLGRKCSNDFAEILLLASNGYGFAALQVLRSMFEKLVDATYLHKHQSEVDAFWNYYLVNLEKLNYEDIADKTDPNWRAIAAKFKTLGKKGARTQPRWSKENLVKMAKDQGFEDHLKHAYYLPNLFIHNSPAEIMFALEQDKNGKLTPVDFNNPAERSYADIATLQAFLLLLKTLELQIEHYGWDDSMGLVQEFGSYLSTGKPT